MGAATPNHRSPADSDNGCAQMPRAAWRIDNARVNRLKPARKRE